MTHLFFAYSDLDRVRAVVAARNTKQVPCRLAVSAGEAGPRTLCTFVSARPHELDGAAAIARSLGAPTEMTTLADEERAIARRRAPHDRFAPRSEAEFAGLWFSKLEQHVCAFDPKRRANVFLICGPSGVGKTCSVETLLPSKVGVQKRVCRVFSVYPDDLDRNADAAAESRSSKKRKGGAAAAAPNDEASTTEAYDAALEHCRRVKCGELPADALLVLFYDDVDCVENRAAAKRVVADWLGVGRLQKTYARNVALVASCTDYYETAPLVHTMRTDKALGVDVTLCKVPPLTHDQLLRRLHQCYPELTYDRKNKIAQNASGNMWAALHAAEFGGALAPMDRENVDASAQRVRELVRTTALSIGRTGAQRSVVASIGGVMPKRSAFVDADLHADIDYGADAIMSNYAALVPRANRQRNADYDCLEALEQTMRVSEMLGEADLYDMHRRNEHYAGRDGVDIDEQISRALNVVSPCVALALATSRAERPADGKLVFVDEHARACRDTLERNSALTIDMATQFALIARLGRDAPLVLAADAAWRRAPSSTTTTAPQTKRQQRLCPAANAMEALELITFVGERGLEYARIIGLSDRDAVRVGAFASELKSSRKTIATVAAEYKALQTANPKLAPPIVAAGTNITLRKRGATQRSAPGSLVVASAADPSDNTARKRRRKKDGAAALGSTPKDSKLKQQTINFRKLAI